MDIRHIIKLTTLTLGLALCTLLITATTQAKSSQNDFSCTAVSEIPQIECEALIAIYNSTDGPNWSKNTGWLVITRACNWYGVTCDSGHVTELILTGDWDAPFGLKGVIPDKIGNLSNLTQLNLNHNQLTTLPDEIGYLTELTGLGLADNQINTLPIELWTLIKLNISYVFCYPIIYTI